MNGGKEKTKITLSNMDFSTFIPDLCVNATSAAVAMFGIWLRNYLLEKKLKATFVNHGISASKNGHGITLVNPTYLEIMVREVSLTTTGGKFLLSYEGPSEEIDSRKNVKLSPFSSGSWFIPTHFNVQDPIWQSVNVEFIYPTLFGGYRRVAITGNEEITRKLWIETYEL